MGAIGRWIDARCAEEPEVMRRVLNRRFGPLNLFFSDGKCGCLVGSWKIERCDELVVYAGSPERKIGLLVYGLTLRRPLLGGSFVTCSNKDRRPDSFVVRLVKQRIRRALGLTPIPHTDVKEPTLCPSSP